MRYGVRQKLCVCTRLARYRHTELHTFLVALYTEGCARALCVHTIDALSAYRTTYVVGCIYTERLFFSVSWCSEPSQPQRITSGLNRLCKSFVCVHDWRVIGRQNYVRFWLYTQRAVQKLRECTRLARYRQTELLTFLAVYTEGCTKASCMYTIGALSAHRTTYVFGCIIHRGLYKSFVCARDWHVYCIRNCVRFWLYLYTEGRAFSSCFFLRLSWHQLTPNHCWTPVLGKKKCC